MIKMKNNLGFTLAEVLITLGIIGVVAALTIPTLMANYQKEQYVNQLKKSYTEISQAVKLLMASDGVTKVTDTNVLTNDGVEDITITKQRVEDEFLTKYFKYIKLCPYTEDISTCFPTNYKGLDNDNIGALVGSRAAIITSSGMSIAYEPGIPSTPAKLFVDINGFKGPNVTGKDFFGFDLYYDGSIDTVNPQCRLGAETSTSSLCGGNGFTNASDAREGMFQNSQNYGSAFGKILNDG